MKDKKMFKLWYLNLNISDLQKINLLKMGYKPYDIYEMSEKELMDIGLNLNEVYEIKRHKQMDDLESYIDYIEKENIDIIIFNEENYPQKLKEIFDPPVGLFVKGKMPEFNFSLAIVGSRKASNYGLTVSYKFAYELSKFGIKIISGLARGIDTAAHRGTIDADGITVGIMGSGFKNIYPSSNKDLIEKIIKKGCVLTEFLPDEKPLPHNFPKRNRIISGLADFILVVEAGEKSGSLITARLALEQGKDVFAVPGNIFNYNSIGTNNLIKDGAKLISTIEDILEEFEISLQKNVLIGYNELELAIINILKIGASTIDDIVENIKRPTHEVISAISKLECKGILKRTFGNYLILN